MNALFDHDVESTYRILNEAAARQPLIFCVDRSTVEIGCRQ